MHGNTISVHFAVDRVSVLVRFNVVSDSIEKQIKFTEISNQPLNGSPPSGGTPTRPNNVDLLAAITISESNIITDFKIISAFLWLVYSIMH